MYNFVAACIFGNLEHRAVGASAPAGGGAVKHCIKGFYQRAEGRRAVARTVRETVEDVEIAAVFPDRENYSITRNSTKLGCSVENTVRTFDQTALRVLAHACGEAVQHIIDRTILVHLKDCAEAATCGRSIEHPIASFQGGPMWVRTITAASTKGMKNCIATAVLVYRKHYPITGVSATSSGSVKLAVTGL